MIKRQVEGHPLDGQIVFFQDDQTGAKYRRIVGGFAWPDVEKPGFAVVVGEVWEEDPATKARPLRVLAEAEDHDAGNLLRRCQEWQGQYQVGEWFGDTFKKPMMAFLRHINEESGRERFSFSPVLHADDPQALPYFLQMIKECLTPNRKILEFGEHSKLPGYLGLVSREEASKSPAEHPPIAALGFAVVNLRTTSPPKPWRPPKRPSYGPGGWMVS